MNTMIFRSRNVGIALALSLCLTEQALAAASYDGNVSLSYLITLLASTNPTAGDDTGLSILGTFQQPSDTASYYGSASGDGLFQTDSPTPASTVVAIASLYNANLEATGYAEFGTVDTLHTGLFGLQLSNTSAYSYTVAVNFNFGLTAFAEGEFASTSIQFDYWNEAGSISGFDYVSAATYTGNANDEQSVVNFVPWSFTLAPGATEQLYAQAGILSHVESSSAPVPLPAAVWLFGSALVGLMGFSRRKTA